MHDQVELFVFNNHFEGGLCVTGGQTSRNDWFEKVEKVVLLSVSTIERMKLVESFLGLFGEEEKGFI